MSRDASQRRTSSRSGFDETPAGDAEDADGEGDARSRPSSVLWERRIEQSIFVDISDDDSLHFSDLQDAFTVHLSQGSGAPEGTDNTDLSCKTEDSSKESVESISSEYVEPINISNKFTKTPMQRPAVNLAIGRDEDDAINTSDEEHEDLPYDGTHINHTTCNDVHETNSKPSSLCEDVNVDETCQSIPACNQTAAKDVAPPQAKPIQVTTHITDFLLRHFTQEELLNSSRMIEAETLPEISLIDSIDETMLHAPQICSGENKLEKPAENHQLLEVTEKCYRKSYRKVTEKYESSSFNESNMMFVNDAVSTGDDDEVDTECPKQSGSLDLSKADAQTARLSFIRTKSFSEMKYGQGQVHYPLPDFSKVASKVKMPKGNANVKPISHSPAITRTQSSPGILAKNTSSCKATADVISRVLEDSVRVKEEQSGLAHQLQVEYDRLIAKYTEAENLIGQQIHASSEPSVSINWNETTTNSDKTKRTAETSQAPARGSGVDQCSLVPNSPSVQTEPQTLTDGERLTSELRDIISSFMQKVDEFKTCINTMSMNVEEQQMMLKSMMEAQDQLERNYLTKRDEHRALEMQNYIGLARNTGEFDPDREVEGQIFRIGMHLEDIKEQIDRNVCHLFNPPPSSSTPSPPPCKDISLSSSHPSLHEDSLFCIYTVRQNIQKEEDEDFEECDEDHRAENSFILQCSSFSTETPGTANEKDRLTAAGAEDVYRDILTQVSTSASLKQHLTHNRHEETIRSGEFSFSSVGNHYTGPSVQTTTDKTQSFVNPENDSGFGSSDLSRPTTGLSQTATNALSLALSDDVISVASLSGSDSNASHSNVQTTISVRLVQPTVNHMEVKKASLGDAMFIHEQMIERREDVHLGKNHAAHDTGDRNAHLPSHCSCHNSEVILALQNEVSHLKRALQESLSHLPHVNKRTDYPNSTSHSERKHRTQTRGQNRAGYNRHVKKNSSLQKTEDWISSDMEPSNSKVTEGEDSDHTLSFQQAFSPSHEQTHDRFISLSDRRSCDTRSPSKASIERFPLDTSQFGPSRSHQRTNTGPALHSNSVDTRPTYKSTSHRPAMGNLGNIFFNSKKPASFFPAHPSHKPLLQVNYGSSCSLPAGFKVRDQESEPPVFSRRRSTQSDSALLPSNVFFQRTSPRTSPRTTCRRRHTSREESIHKTLDKALQAAFLMKQTTDRMADALSADLAKAQLQRKLHGLHPLNRT